MLRKKRHFYCSETASQITYELVIPFTEEARMEFCNNDFSRAQEHVSPEKLNSTPRTNGTEKGFKSPLGRVKKPPGRVLPALLRRGVTHSIYESSVSYLELCKCSLKRYII